MAVFFFNALIQLVKQKNVNVIIRSEHKEIFSGIFYTSMFNTNVNDVTEMPYYVDMIVEHEDDEIVSS